jgi:nucleotide-binding universal stress UspA family protein
MGSPVFVGIQRILVAYDASPHAERALDVAQSMAADLKAKIFLLAVIRPPEPAESAEFNALLKEGRERNFAPLRERIKQKNIEFETDIVLGHPADEIIHWADSNQARLIVMGKRSHTILRRSMLGSNSEPVLRYAQCPVMSVH